MTGPTQSRHGLAHDVLHQTRPHPLDAIFVAKKVALIGATETPGSVGLALTQNLEAKTFGGVVYPINPRRDQIFGEKAYPNIAAVPDKLDLAVIVTPAPTVPAIMSECVAAGVQGAIIISAGFKEIGAAGVELERQILAEARRGFIRVIGPNCLGVMIPHAGFNATFASAMARPGNVAFISQSGALCTAVLDWSFRENVGFSAFVSVGSMLDVNWGDLIYYLGDDPHTKSIVIYMESIGDARSFLSAAREVALTKPIIVIKAGRTEAAAKAAASHTGSLTGSDEVLDAAFRRVGVLRVNVIADLFNMAEVLAKQPRPRGPRLTIVTNAGGPAVLATDALVTNGGQLAELSPETFAAFDELLPPHWSRNNPIDILGDAGPDRYGKAVEIAAKDPNSDGLLVILTPQAMTDPTATAEQLKPFAKLDGKPILASWMGGAEVDAGEDILNAVSIPTFEYPDTAARAFQYMWRYSENLRSLYETPVLAEASEAASKRAVAEKIIASARKVGRTILTEVESKQVLSAYGIPIVETHIATSEAEAVKLAGEIGYPVVLKVYSETITHKTDVGGVQLNLRNAAAVRRAWREISKSVKRFSLSPSGREGRGEGVVLKSEILNRKSETATPHSDLLPSTTGEGNISAPAPGDFLGVTVQPMLKPGGYELILGSSTDPQFGPVLLFGTGGQLVEIFKDRALALPPLNATLARRMMEQTRIYAALKGVRGRQPVDLAGLEQLLVAFSQLVVEQRWIKEIDINPLLASSDRLIALDARVVLHGADVTEDRLPKLAIRPYPAQYVLPWKMKDGTPLTLRPIRPEDEPLLVKFHETLSERSVYYRYFSTLKLGQRIAHERLIRICFNDYDREIAIVADHKNSKTGEHEILGVGRLSKNHGLNEAEFAILISDQWQGRGLGTELLKLLVRIGRAEKLARIIGHILPDNREMNSVARKAGFTVAHEPQTNECLASIEL